MKPSTSADEPQTPQTPIEAAPELEGEASQAKDQSSELDSPSPPPPPPSIHSSDGSQASLVDAASSVDVTQPAQQVVDSPADLEQV